MTDDAIARAYPPPSLQDVQATAPLRHTMSACQRWSMVALGERAAKLAAAVELVEKADFKKSRGLIRSALRNEGVAAEIDGAVAELLDAEATKP